MVAPGSREAEMPTLSWLLFIPSRPPAQGAVPPTSRVDLPPQLVLPNITLRDTKRCASVFSILNPVTLTMETDYHRDEGRFQVHHFQHQCPMNGGHMCVVAKAANVAIVHMSSHFLWRNLRDTRGHHHSENTLMVIFMFGSTESTFSLCLIEYNLNLPCVSAITQPKGENRCASRMLW